MVIMSFFLVCRLFYLQVIKTDYFQVKAEENRINVSPIAPNRGLIFDRNGNVLARNYSLNEVFKKVADKGIFF